MLDPGWPALRRLHELAPIHSEVLAVAGDSFQNKRPPAIRGGGYVAHLLEAALWAFHDAADFREAVLTPRGHGVNWSTRQL
jgi:hypothetical protein